jgi:hypothetical protein
VENSSDFPLSNFFWYPSTVYKAPTIATPASVMTLDLRVYGQIHTPPQADLASVMNHPRPFFPMTQCVLYKPSLEFPPAPDLKLSGSDFLVLPKSNVLWIAEPESNDLEVRRSYRNLYLLYSTYLLKGEVNIPGSVRLSDFLTRSLTEKAFQYMYRVEVRLPKPDGSLLDSKVIGQFEVVLVNLRNVAGFYDISEDSSKPDLSGF